mmetsp:Transcript_20159/g.32517  ORF Transcript_20159/g.32517 Transcript_20159/m.32517 type:complete len:162 (-) Transcript_20159:159-644(-)
MNHDDFMVIYPSYLDASKSIKQGRRIGKEKAVDTPTLSDISQALQSLQLRHVLQPHKGYPRDTACLWDNPGRVKVERPKFSIMDENDDPASTKRKLLLELAEAIPKLPSRQQRLEKAREEAAKKEAEQEEAKKKQQHAQPVQQQLQPTSASASKKKGKKKR